MTENQERMAVEAHVRALVLLQDAMKKKARLLLVKEMEHEKKRELDPDCPFLDQQLVLNLIDKLQEVQLLKDGNLAKEATMVHVIPYPDSVSIILCQSFWEGKEHLDLWSRPGALILAAAHILGYRDYPMDKYDVGTLKASEICAAFEIWMNHDGIYENGVYTCCGEEVRDSVCEESRMSCSLLPYIPESDETYLKQATLDILLDSQKKCLLVELTEEPQALLITPKFPIITISLVQDLIRKLKEVKFKCDRRPNSMKIAYTNPKTRNVIYMCPLFREEKDYLCQGSHLGTIILHAAQLLGYRYHLDGATEGNTSYATVQHYKRSTSPTSLVETINQNFHNHNSDSALSCPSNIGSSLLNKSETSSNNETTADMICAAFEMWMSHKGNYENGSYTCCMETSRHSVCEKSVMKSCLQLVREENLKLKML
ncbi:uncharacterized protein ACMZJ9_010839 [Mantella aurantiaca]